MSARHTRTGHLANELHDGTLFVAGLEPCWFQNAHRPGQHRRPERPPYPEGMLWWSYRYQTWRRSDHSSEFL